MQCVPPKRQQHCQYSEGVKTQEFGKYRKQRKGSGSVHFIYFKNKKSYRRNVRGM